jgi:hypothetical protein
MSPDDKTELEKLLTTFKATCLGEGDTNAGTNLLAAMAVTLANLSRTGSGIQPPDIGRMRAGSSLLVTGSLSSSLVMDDVVTEVAIRQNVLIAQIRRLVGDKIADARSDKLRAVEFPQGPKSNDAENALYQLEQRDPTVPVDVRELWRDVLSVPPNPRIDDLAAQPKFLVTAKGPEDLGRRLVGLHGNRPLIVLGLNQPADAEGYASTCESLLNGLVPVGDLGETAGGHLLVCDPTGVLPEVAPRASGRAAWLGRTVWLVDGTAGPDATGSQPAGGKIRVGDMAARFGEALTAVLARRLDNHDAGTVAHEFDLVGAQLRWVAFLKGMEGRLPGITGTARSLLPTLAFGLIELAGAPDCGRLPVSVAEVEALARWIVNRMANARAAMLFSVGEVWKLRYKRKILAKLAGGNFDNRSIYRALHLAAALCEDLMEELESASLVRRSGREWERIGRTTLPADPDHRLPLEA